MERVIDVLLYRVLIPFGLFVCGMALLQELGVLHLLARMAA